MKCVDAEAPVRIDLAGGTLDIPPLDLLVPDAITVNIAVDLMASARVEEAESGYRIRSVDQGAELRFDSLEAMAADGGLPLLSGLLAHFAPTPGVTLETRCASPAGAGLGGSSSLAVAVTGALAAYAGVGLEADRILQVARDVETRVLGVPTGVQDYVAALRGGACALEFGVGGMRVEALPTSVGALRERTVLVYTGAPRSSGINNWQVTKSFLDGDTEVRRALQGIAVEARRAQQALAAGDLDALAIAVGAEWGLRRELAPGVTTAEIESLLGAAGMAGAMAGKVCGAGGGGCVLLLVAQGRQAAVEESVRDLGMTVLEFEFAPRGLTVAERGTGR